MNALRRRIGGIRPQLVIALALLAVATLASIPFLKTSAQQAALGARSNAEVLSGEAAKGDWSSDAPGIRRKLTVADLPAPFATKSVDNGPKMIPRPEGAMPQVPAGFKAEMFATGLTNPRMVRVAPNGDLFIAESKTGELRLMRDANGDGKPEVNQVFASGLRQPFGVAFYPSGANPRYVYVANTDSVVRFAYQNGDIKARGGEEMIVSDIPGGGRLRGGGHWTRDVLFSKDGKKMYIAVGSKSNVMEKPEDVPLEERRARILEFTPDGKNERNYATGIRNPVGLALHPETGDVWTSVNERDGLGDHLVPDYVTRVEPGAFYGWPWYYMGSNQDPRHEGQRPELKGKVTVPDVLLQSHSASLGMTFYTGQQFPTDYRLDAFAAEHGSWNRERRTGYKVVRIPVEKGRATGEYEDFMTGFVTANGDVWGRPASVAVAKDGSLYVADDGSNSIWRVSYASANKK